jgi:hypothetical protein
MVDVMEWSRKLYCTSLVFAMRRSCLLYRIHLYVKLLVHKPSSRVLGLVGSKTYFLSEHKWIIPARRSLTFGICLNRQSAKTVIFLLSLVFQIGFCLGKALWCIYR